MPSTPFDGNTLKSVAALYERKDGVKPKPRIYRDTVQAGLIISAGKTGAVWKISTNSLNRSLGDFVLYNKDDIPKLRQLVAMCLVEHKAGRKIDEMITFFKVYKDLAQAVAEQAVANGNGMKWPEARDEFLAWAYKNKATPTVDGYKSALGACGGSVYEKDFRIIASKALASITLGDLSRIKESIVNRGAAGELKGTGLRQADLTVAALRSAFRYFMDKPTIYNLENNVALGLTNVQESDENDEDKEVDDGLRAMTQLELGMFVYALESETNEIARNASLLQALTGQRRFAAVIARRKLFKENAAYGVVWQTKGKGNTWRTLPLGPIATDLTRQSLEDFAKYESSYLFPKVKVRRAGDEKDGPVSKRQVSRVMERMREPGGIFYGLDISPSTHSLRKAFITYFKPRMHTFSVDGVSLKEDQIKMITHVNEGRADTASSVYDLNDYLSVKYAILCEWERYVMEGYEMYVASLEKMKAAA